MDILNRDNTKALHCFLDTSIYIKEKLKLDGKRFSSFSELRRSGIIISYHHQLIEHELLQYYCDLISSKEVKNLQKSFLKIDVPNEKVFIKKIRMIVFSHKSIELSSKELDVEKILNNYYKQLPPFSSESKKQHEFKDAFMLESINKKMGNDGIDTFHVVSADNDWRKFCEQNEMFVYYDSLDKFIDFANQSSEYYNETRELILDKKSIIKEKLQNILDENSMRLIDFDWELRRDESLGSCDEECELLECNNISLTKTHILKIAENEVLFDIHWTASCSIQHTQSFPGMYFGYDSETGDYRMPSEELIVDHKLYWTTNMQIKDGVVIIVDNGLDEVCFFSHEDKLISKTENIV